MHAVYHPGSFLQKGGGQAAFRTVAFCISGTIDIARKTNATPEAIGRIMLSMAVELDFVLHMTLAEEVTTSKGGRVKSVSQVEKNESRFLLVLTLHNAICGREASRSLASGIGPELFHAASGPL